jgi:hypothetical protein
MIDYKKEFYYEDYKPKPFYKTPTQSEENILNDLEPIENKRKTYKFYKEAPLLDTSKMLFLNKDNILMIQFFFSIPITIFINRVNILYKNYNMFNRKTLRVSFWKHFFGVNLFLGWKSYSSPFYQPFFKFLKKL